MPSDHSATIRRLSQINDAGLFERIATAVLRTAAPSLYGNLSHPGMNPAGKTVKSVVDGISFVLGATPAHMVTVHHTTVGANELRGKWLHDPLTVRARKGKPTAPPGDVVKTALVVADERKRTPDLQATLALTTNKEPGVDLARDVVVAGRKHAIEIDVWSVSRIASFLDLDPRGQYIRKSFLGNEQELLSAELLAELSRRSLSGIPLMTDSSTMIGRDVDKDLAQCPKPVAFVVGESGFGKTVACYKRLHEHIAAGGFGIAITHEILSASRTLDEAIDAQLR